MSTLISKLEKFNIEKQLEKRVIKYYSSKVSKEQRPMIKEYFTNKDNLKEAKEEYLNTHPEVKKEYIEKKKNQLRVKIALAAGTLTVGTLAGAFALKEDKQPIVDNTQIEQTQEFEEEVNQALENENKYDEFFEMIENEDNTDKRNKMILNKTKEIIANAYNKENPNNPITTEKLQILILSESVLVKSDRLGNTTYERSTDIGYDDLKENEQLVSKGKVYVFSIDGKNVATFMENGDRLEDKSIENEEPFFGKTMDMVKEYQKLSDNFKYSTTESLTDKAENSFKEKANKLLNENNLNKETQQELAEK